MKFKVNAKLLPVKACYFFFFGGVAPILPFLPVYAHQLGVSEVGVGTIYLALPVLASLMRPLVGGLADATHRHKLVFLLLLTVTTVGYAALHFLPPLPAAPSALSADVQLDCGGQTFVRVCAGQHPSCHAQQLAAAAHNATALCQLQCDQWPDCGSAWCRSASVAPPPLQLQLDLNGADLEGRCLFLPVWNVSGGEGPHSRPTCRSAQTVSCRLSCDDATLMKALDAKAVDTGAYYRTSQFWLMVLFLVLAWVGTSLSVPLADSIAFKLLDDPARYGYQRVWGSIGWGAFSFLSGYLVDVASAGRHAKDYSHAFYLLVGLMVLNIIVCTRLRVSSLKEARPKFRAGLGALLRRPRVLLFLLSCCVVGTMTGVLWTFFFLHLQDVALAWDCSAYEWISIISGGTLLVQCFFGEVPFFFISGWIIGKLGHVHTQTVVLLAFGVRFLLYSLLRNPWLVLPVELLNGLTFGLFYANMVAYAGVIAPPGMTATLQGLVGASFECVGVAIGSGTGGLLYYAVGGARMFQVYGLLSLTAGALYVLMQCIVTYRCGEQPGPRPDNGTLPDTEGDGMLREMH
ncbi:major facilitator superfamily domain-containing protein 6-B-like, partial [Pollicipes pollicipes]|uniref:major facilitator superfamily domain-containing protein 6-B-like n=1 Tax=Pollicipes pollicipes TaxID=41117 RepID=UPI0018859633